MNSSNFAKKDSVNARNLQIGNFEKFKNQPHNNLPDQLPNASDRLKNIEVIKEKNKFQPVQRDPMVLSIRFMNLGDDKIVDCFRSVRNNTALPLWAQYLTDGLRIVKNQLYYKERPFWLREKRHLQVKKVYFHPGLPVSQDAIYDYLEKKCVNLTRQFCRNSLKGIAHYQKIFRRRKPQNINSKFVVKKPGMIACDCFFPTLYNGWHNKRTCLAICDVWSRYTQVYVLTSKHADLVNKCMLDFLRKFLQFGWKVRRCLCDKGTEFNHLHKIFNKFRKKNEKGPMVMNPATAQPVNYIENLNSQIQANAQACLNITQKPEELMHYISTAINTQKRKRKGNFTPIELLRMTPREVMKINRENKNTDVPGISSLKPLYVGDRVRILMMTRKEQEKTNLSDQKGFSVKWSGKVYTILRKKKLQKNHDVFQYWLNPAPTWGGKQSRYRHELLKIPKRLDTVIPKLKGKLSTKLYSI